MYAIRSYYDLLLTELKNGQALASVSQKFKIPVKQTGFFKRNSPIPEIGAENDIARVITSYSIHYTKLYEITVSYWTDLDSIQHWKSNSDHLLAQEHGREKWYKSFKTRIAKVERNYEF